MYSVEDMNDRELITQLSSSVIDFSSQYGSDTKMSYSAMNLAGKPNIYPKYGDFNLAFPLRTYGPWWEMAPSAPKSFRMMADDNICSQDFIELKFDQPVYPQLICIYETYNPGAVTKIFACDSTTQKWELLWSGICENAPHCARIFSPPLNPVNFLTNVIRIEFHHRHLDYYSEYDAVSLTGTLKSPLIQDCTKSNICEQIKDLCILDSIDTTKLWRLGDREATSNKNYIKRLPGEVFFLIVSKLDLRSLCRAACSSRLLRKRCYDPQLFTELNLKPYWYKVNSETLESLLTRCTHLQRLNLSWCGNNGKLSSNAVMRFMYTCGSSLTCISLQCCRFVSNDVLKVIADVCSNLQELDLSSCQQISLDQTGFQQICNMTRLTRLNMYRTLVDLLSIKQIVRCCQQLEYLNVGACTAISNFDEVMCEIQSYCRNIKGLDLWRAKSLTSAGICTISKSCPNLLELDIGWCFSVLPTDGCIVQLVRHCTRLKKLFLTAIRTFSDNDILEIAANCCDLEQLDILGTGEVSPESCFRLLNSCQALKLLDVSFCGQINSEVVNDWIRLFPNVSIKRSFQNISAV